MLLDRLAERAALGQLVDAARGGRSGALVVHGEAGVGKTALLEDVIAAAAGLRMARVAGIESEMELAYAALQQLCAQMLDGLDRLPGPQREALGVAFGLRTGEAPDRFLVGLAALSLLADAANKEPLLCVIDDAQWLDRASAQAIGFVARRLFADQVAVVVATRERGGEFRGLPELAVGGLGDGDARDLLASVIRRPLDERVQERFIAEAGGNPLALLELPQGLTPAERTGAVGVTAAPGLLRRLEDSFGQRLGGLPATTQRLLLVAAAEPTGDPVLVWRAAGDRNGSGGPGRGRGVADDRRAGDLPASAGPVGSVPGGVPRTTAGHAPGAGQLDRPAGRPGSPRLAPGPGGGRARRGGCRRAGALRRPGASARGVRRGGRVLGTLGRADARPGAASGPSAGRRAGHVPGWRIRCGTETASCGGSRAAG